MRINIFNVIYWLFILSLVFGSSIYIGPVTPRQFFAVVMGIFCVFNLKSLKRFIVDKVIFAYIIFLVVEGVSFIYENRIEFFLRDLISKHCVAIVAYLSTVLLYKKVQNLNALFGPLIIAALINGIICILQYIGNPSALALGAIFTDLENESTFSNFKKMAEGTGDYVFGLLGNPVNNGLFMMFSFFAPIAFITKDTLKIKVGVLAGILLFIYVCIFIIQQRSCLLIVTVLAIYFLWKRFHLKKIFLFLLGILPVFFLFAYNIDVDNIIANTRYEHRDITDEPRYYLYMKAISYISSHFLLGGIGKFLNEVGNLPHNIILNAFVYTGILGAVPILYIYFKQIYTSFVSINKNVKKNNQLVSAALALMAISLNSLLHNNSIISGEIYIWIFWGVLQISRKHL